MKNDASVIVGKLVIGIGGVCAYFAGMFGITVLRAYTLATLWYWYIVPGFHLEPMRLPVAYGVSLLVGVMTYRHKVAKAGEKVEDWAVAKAFGVGIGSNLVVLLFGWLGTWFM